MKQNSTEEVTHEVHCWHCRAEFNAAAAVWCSCSVATPSKLCPFCLACFCSAPAEYHHEFWAGAPAPLQADRDSLSRRRLLLGEMLVAGGRITREQLMAALRHQADTGAQIGTVLVRLGLMGEGELSDILHAQQAPVSFDLKNRVVNANLARVVGVKECLARRLLPIESETLNHRRIVLMAMANPSDQESIRLAAGRLNARVVPGYTPERTIVSLLKQIFPHETGAGTSTPKSRAEVAQRMLENAVRSRASHLYIELTHETSRLAYRVDGVLYRLKGSAGAVDERHVDAVESLFPAGPDSPIEVRCGHRRALARLSLSRSQEVTSLSVRFHNPEIVETPVDSLQLDTVSRNVLRRTFSPDVQSGLVVLAGPPHGGTDRTFWSLINGLLRADRPVALMNAPFPHPDPRVSHWNPASSGPDALCSYRPGPGDLVEGIAESRHRLVILRLVRSHVHEVFRDILAAGVAGDELADSLRLFIHQRAVRRVCERCFEPVAVEPAALRNFGLTREEGAALSPFRGTGCDVCALGTGHAGIEPVLEIVEGGPALAEEVRRFAGDGSSMALPRPSGQSLRDAGLELVRRGLTTLEEFRKLALIVPA